MTQRKLRNRVPVQTLGSGLVLWMYSNGKENERDKINISCKIDKSRVNLCNSR